MGKTKKASKAHWKRISHQDVDEFLEVEREKERHDFTGESDASLFRLDNGGATGRKDEPESDKLVDFSKLKCFQIFKPSSTVPDPLIKRNTLKINSRVKVKKFGPSPAQEDNGVVDPWAVKSAPKEVNDWLNDTIYKRQKGIITKKHRHLKTTELKAVDIPHPGFSVNPTFGDHQDLLQAAVDTEMLLKKKEAKLWRATKIPDNAIEYDEMMKIEPYTIDDTEVKTEDESDEDTKPIITKPKTKKQRRQEKLELDQQNSRKDQKKVKQMESDIYRIKQIRQEIDEEDKQRKAKLLKKVNKKIESDKFGQKALSRFKYEPEKLNPLLSDELSGRLVDVKATPNLLLDRFKSLQKRNILEVRKRHTMKRIHPMKPYVRPSEKMEWEKTGYWNGVKLLTKTT